MRRFDLRHLTILIPIGILLVVQLPNLSLPYFWDEAWSYIKAITKMSEVGPSLLPGRVPIEYSKGHPQFFYFLASTWMNLWGGSIVAMRILSLIISICLLLTVYFGLEKIANWQSAITGATLVSVQSMFLAQSILVLPEVLVSLLFVFSFFLFVSRNYLGYALSCILMVQTKETTIVLALVFGLFYLFRLSDQAERSKFRWQHLIALLSPGLIYLLFLVLHKHAFGVAFNSDHLDYFSTDIGSIIAKTKSALAHIFVHSGRTALTVIAFATITVAFFRNDVSMRPVTLALIAIVFHILFSVLNFFSPRYGLVAILAFITVFAYLWGQFKLNPYIRSVVIIALSIVCLGKSLTKKNNLDTTLGYIETVKVFQDIVNYCEDNQLQDEAFAVSFNMTYNLSDRAMGYIRGEKDFSNIRDWNHYKDAKYFIFESSFGENQIVRDVQKNFCRIQAFSREHAWAYIYENPLFQKEQGQNDEKH